MQRCSRSDLSTRGHVAKYANLLVVCEVAKQIGQRCSPNLLFNSHFSKKGGENALNVLNKAEERQVNCYVFEWVIWTVSQCKYNKLDSKLYHFIVTGSRHSVKIQMQR